MNCDQCIIIMCLFESVNEARKQETDLVKTNKITKLISFKYFHILKELSSCVIYKIVDVVMIIRLELRSTYVMFIYIEKLHSSAWLLDYSKIYSLSFKLPVVNNVK